MNSTKKFQFKTIDVDTNGRPNFRSPYSHNPYDQLSPRKDIVKAWNEESRLRAEELEILHNNTHNTDTDTDTE